MAQETDQETIAHLQDLVRKHNVFYAVYQERVLKEESIERVGFDLELYGIHDHPQGIINPGCDQCETVYEDLKEIAGGFCRKKYALRFIKSPPSTAPCTCRRVANFDRKSNCRSESCTDTMSRNQLTIASGFA